MVLEWQRRMALGCMAALFAITAGCGAAGKAAKLVLHGDSRELRERPEGAPARSKDRPAILFLALDGVDRAMLYDMLRRGQLPQLAALLGGKKGRFPHAHFEDSLVATLPSSTISAWATVITGVAPALHGVTGNEFFIRDKRIFAAPIPTTFQDVAPVISNLTSDAYVGSFLRAPTIYERMRERDPDVLVWVAMHQFYAGADLLIVAGRSAFAGAWEAMLKRVVTKVAQGKESRAVYEKLDHEVVEIVCEELNTDDGPIPDVLTVYLVGADLYAHVAEEGPEVARRAYLREVLDPEIGLLRRQLMARGALEDRWVVVTSDHGHTEVRDDDEHALATKAEDDPPRVLEHAGFRVREFTLEVDEDDDFQAVLAYQGAMAFVYLADRTTCETKDRPCDWRRPPRYREDVLAVAEAFHAASKEGAGVPGLKGKLDLVLARKPRPYAQDDLPFSVYVGDGRLVPVRSYLAANLRPDLVALEARLRDLAVGPHGERAGDVVLMARYSDRNDPADRYYFSTPYHSWHGSASKSDSEVPLIVAHPAHSSAHIRATVDRVLGKAPRQQKVGELLLSLRFSQRKRPR